VIAARAIVLFAAAALAQPVVRAFPPDAMQQRAPTDASGGAALAVVVLVDVSRGSWPVRDLFNVKEAVGRALAASLRDGDWVAVGSVSDQVRLPEAPTRMPADVKPLLREPFDVSWGARHGNTPIWDAVDRSVGLLARAPSGARRVVLLYTSGRPAGNVLSLPEVVARARVARVAVHVVFRSTPQSRLEQHDSTDVLWIRPDLLLRELTTGTGGVLVTADVLSSTGLRDVFAGMLSGARDRGPGH
jgi:hypothetical protein